MPEVSLPSSTRAFREPAFITSLIAAMWFLYSLLVETLPSSTPRLVSKSAYSTSWTARAFPARTALRWRTLSPVSSPTTGQ